MIDNKTIYQVDAFANKPFSGNPAGVMIVDESVSTDWMQKMAMEMCLSETAYLIPKGEHFTIRYFTPTTEVPLCGHATLASAHVLYELGIKGKEDKITFESLAGLLTIDKDNDWIRMSLPTYSIEKVDCPKEFSKVIGFEPIETYKSSYNWIVAIAESEEDIIESEPDFEGMKKVGLGQVIITSKSSMEGIDFAHRCFAPSAGINEDPATGSACCALAPVWFQKTNQKEFSFLQRSKRTAELKAKLVENRVEVSGKALTIFKAELKVKPS